MKLGDAVALEAHEPGAVLLDEFTRCELAPLPARRGLATGEVSYLVGFSVTSASFKALRRWTGKSPGEYRAALAM